MKELIYTADIQAPRETVWETMLADETYRQWTDVAWPGSLYKGEWKLNENIRFIGEDGSGILANITGFDPFYKVAITHMALLNKGGSEDTESDVAKSLIGTKEVYTFTGNKNTTHLEVSLTINAEWEQMFSDGWPKALAKLKEICEQHSD